MSSTINIPPIGVTLALALSLIVLLFAILVYVFQNRLIYIPQLPPGSKTQIWRPSRFGWGRSRGKGEAEDEDWQWEEADIVAKDGVHLQAFWIKAPQKLQPSLNEDNNNDREKEELSTELRERFIKSSHSVAPFTIIYMQANAGNIGHRLPIAKKLQEMINCNILMISYRGYGQSGGSPSEKGIKLDAQAALDYVWNEKLRTAEERGKIAVYGQSIGGAVSIHLAHSNPDRVRYLILENTFLSIPKLIPRIAPIFRPFSALCHQKWDSSAIISKISQRILFLSGGQDELIPTDHMVQLNKLALRSPHRKFVSFSKGTHNDTCVQVGYFEAIRDFLLSQPKQSKVTVEEVTDEDA